jgi:hypothetical protein
MNRCPHMGQIGKTLGELIAATQATHRSRRRQPVASVLPQSALGNAAADLCSGEQAAPPQRALDHREKDLLERSLYVGALENPICTRDGLDGGKTVLV